MNGRISWKLLLLLLLHIWRSLLRAIFLALLILLLIHLRCSTLGRIEILLDNKVPRVDISSVILLPPCRFRLSLLPQELSNAGLTLDHGLPMKLQGLSSCLPPDSWEHGRAMVSTGLHEGGLYDHFDVLSVYFWGPRSTRGLVSQFIWYLIITH